VGFAAYYGNCSEPAPDLNHIQSWGGGYSTVQFPASTICAPSDHYGITDHPKHAVQAEPHPDLLRLRLQRPLPGLPCWAWPLGGWLSAPMRALAILPRMPARNQLSKAIVR
jgi:hypothetical protein